MTDRAAGQTGPTRRHDSRANPEQELALVTPELERAVGVKRDELISLLLLETVKGFGPQKFKDLREAGLHPDDVLQEPERLPIRGKRGDAFRDAIGRLDAADRNVAQARAVRQLVRAHEHRARILTFDDALYPPSVYDSNNPIPVVYARGNFDILRERRAVACVGSRKTSPPYSERHYEFARFAGDLGFTVVSGFALGADTIGHRAALEGGHATVLVMPCGIDRPFPPENKELFEELTHYGGAVIVSEFSFGTAASGLTLRKRNKLIVAFAAGVLISESSDKGGAMNAYRFALEQHKSVSTFGPDGQARTSGNAVIAHGNGRLDQLQTIAGANVFSPDRPDLASWERWLQQLSYST